MANREEINAFLKTDFPQFKCSIEAVGNAGARVRSQIGQEALRPGGTVCGTVLMNVADEALYVAILGEIGIVPFAVTTHLSINFLRKPPADKDVIGECKLMKVGKSLAVGEVTIYADGNQEPVAHAVGTYAIPPKGR